MKILILVLSFADKGIYSKFFETQRKTWDSEFVEGVETFYYFGNHNSNEIIEEKILLDIEESYYNCGYKLLKSLKLIENKNFDFLLRTNSSSYIDKKLLKIFLENKPKNNFYSGVVGNFNGIKFASGSGFILSKDVVNLLIENENIFNHRLIDDVAVGDVLKKFNIFPVNQPRFDCCNQEAVINDETPMNFFHYRLKGQERVKDIQNMILLKEKKDKFYTFE